MRRRRLLRAAAVGAVAYRAGTHVDRGRHDAAAPVVPAPDMHAKLKMLDDLATLRERGVLGDEEFAQQKQRVLEG